MAELGTRSRSLMVGLVLGTVLGLASLALAHSVGEPSDPGIEEPPLPSWVLPDGREDPSKLPAFLPVVDSKGRLVGCVRTEDLDGRGDPAPLPGDQPSVPEVPIPVVDAEGHVVGHLVQDRGFVALGRASEGGSGNGTCPPA